MKHFLQLVLLFSFLLTFCLESSAIGKSFAYDSDSTSRGVNPRLSKISNTALTNLNIASWNSAWVDFDKDGDQDLYICNYDKTKSNVLFRNDGGGVFTQISTGALVQSNGLSSVAASFADLDNDGFIDLAVAVNLGQTSQIFKNSNGNFNVLSTEVKNDNGYGHGINWVDYDNDGLLDLFITEYFPTHFARLYHNEGNGQLKRVYNTLTEHANYSTGTTWVDYDGDGFQDLFIPNGGGLSNSNNHNNSLYKNLGNGNFTKISTGAIVNDGGNSTASSWGDYNNDGLLDLFVSNASNQINFLYKNLGGGNFQRILQEPFLSDQGNSHGCIWLDYNNDGWLDLIVLNDQDQNNFFYENNGDGTFSKIIDEPIVDQKGSNKGIACADYDKDGDLDIFITTHADNAPGVLYRNNHNPSNNWINIKLKGTNSNLSAIGARVRVKVKIKGNYVWQLREIQTNTGFGSQSELAAVFGLDNANKIDSIEIRWPSGYYQYIVNQPINVFMVVTEPNLKKVAGKVFDDKNKNGIQDFGEPGISGIKVNVNIGNNFTYTDSKGDFYAYLLPSSKKYLFTQDLPPYWKQNSPLNNAGYNVKVNTDGTFSPSILFGNIPNVAGKDLSVSLTASVLRRGFTNYMTLLYSNKGTLDGSNDTITITLDNCIHLLNASIPWNSKSGNTYKWVMSAIPVGYSGVITLTDSVDLSKPVGTQVTLSSSISTFGDLNASDNVQVTFDEIKGAIDPNDIAVSPKGKGEEGFIKSGTKLTYKIRFQNVGNYMANSVKISSKLQKQFDLSSFEIKNASHAHQMLLQENGELLIYFDHIYLVDSVTNEKESHGYFEYSIETYEGLPGGTQLFNQAEIVFDYEEAITTNIVLNTISPSESIDVVQIYPNPSSEVINVVLDQTFGDRSIDFIEVYDRNGLPIFNKKGIGTNKVIFYKSEVLSGFLILKVVDDQGDSYFDRFIVL